jgi:hypothetical protein
LSAVLVVARASRAVGSMVVLAAVSTLAVADVSSGGFAFGLALEE